jgi:hypothetical protein
MVRRSNRVRLVVGLTVVAAAGTFLGTAAGQKASVPRAQDRLALGEEHVKQLLLIMEVDSRGMISKQEYLKFMEAEFERLDKARQGKVNAREVNQQTLSASRNVGK